MQLKQHGRYPVDAHISEIADALSSHSVCLVKAQPGTGKTTRIPPYLLDTVRGRILVLEPRRLAARLSAERAAWFLDEACGKTVGYRIRHDSCVSEHTRLTFITEGLFVRLLHQDQILSGVGAVVLDEFHERSIHTDMALALVRRLQARSRPDLKLLIMSATLDTRALERCLETPAVIDIGGSVFPVAIDYISPHKDARLQHKDWQDRLADAAARLLGDSRCQGNILVFLTGLGQIMQAVPLLTAQSASGEAEIVPLAADLPPARQKKAFTPSNKRKIVLATNVAETSLTLPDTGGVIDMGLAKIAGMSSWSGMPTLETKRISRASAIQRAGRAGRTRSGVCYRLYSKADFLARDSFTPPDIERLDFTHSLLDIMALGLSEEMLPWFEAPGEKTLAAAHELLTMLGAVDGHGSLTDSGRQLATLPLHPRLGAVALSGREQGCPADALLAACMISEGFIADESLFPQNDIPCDVCRQLAVMKAPGHNRRARGDTWKKARVHSLFRSLAGALNISGKVPEGQTDHRRLAACLLRGFPDRVAVKRTAKKARKGRSPLYNFCMGRGGTIAEDSALAAEPPDYFIAIDALENPRGDAAKGIRVRSGSKVDMPLLRTDPGRLMHSEIDRTLNTKKGDVQIYKKTYYGKLIIEQAAGGSIPDKTEEDRLAALLKNNWPYPFTDDSALEAYHCRVALLDHYGIKHGCPVFEGEMMDLFCEAVCHGKRSLKDLEKKRLEEHILDQLSRESRDVLNCYTPETLRLENGKTVHIRYEKDSEPWSQCLIQDLFRVKRTPAILEGKKQILLRLLAPNRRVAQITADLAAFWKGSYHEVVRDLRRRYPKHYWPDDPARARPLLLNRQARS